MKHKRIFIPEVKDAGWLNPIIYYCLNCGTEIVGDDTFFKEYPENRDVIADGLGITPSSVKKIVKQGLTCPVCGAPVNDSDPGCFLDMSLNGIAYDAMRQGLDFDEVFKEQNGRYGIDYTCAFNNFFCTYYYNEAQNSIQLLHYSKVPDENQEYLHKIGEPPRAGNREEISKYFSFLKRIRSKREESSIEGNITAIVTECEAQTIDTIDTNPSNIKSSPEILKQYLEHLINLESEIHSTKKRLEELYRVQIPVEEEARVRCSMGAEKQQNDLKKAWEAFRNLPTEETYAPLRPQKPVAPKEPTLKVPGLFNRKRIEEENAAILQGFESRKKQYQQDLENYYKEVEKFENDTRDRIDRAKRLAEADLNKAKAALEKAIANPPPSVENAEKKLIEAEIEKAKEALKRLIKAKNELYALNVIYGKYREIVALSSFYEYLTSGRCDALEGRDGAYNIYEGEIRANQIISQLNDVMNSLEQIKNNQYMVYSTIKGVYSSLEQLNSKTEAALTAMDKMQGDISQISKQSEVIAYNTEQAAFYAKKNKELTDALGFLVALK